MDLARGTAAGPVSSLKPTHPAPVGIRTGSPGARGILRFLARRGRCVCGEIVKELPLAQSTVSQHLKILKETGLVRGEVEGPRVCYCLSPRALRRFKALVGAL